MRSDCSLVSNSSTKALHPCLSVALLCAHFGPGRQSSQGCRAMQPQRRCWGKWGPPFLLWTCSELLSSNIPTPFSRHTREKSLLSTFSLPPGNDISTHHSPPFNFFSHKSRLTNMSVTVTSLQPPCGTSFWSSNGCILHAFLIFSASMPWQRVILMTQPRAVHTQTYAFAHMLQKENVHFKPIHQKCRSFWLWDSAPAHFAKLKWLSI